MTDWANKPSTSSDEKAIFSKGLAGKFNPFASG